MAVIQHAWNALAMSLERILDLTQTYKTSGFVRGFNTTHLDKVTTKMMPYSKLMRPFGVFALVSSIIFAIFTRTCISTASDSGFERKPDFSLQTLATKVWGQIPDYRDPSILDDFMARFPGTKEEHLAYTLRFALLQEQPTFRGYQEFIDKYPNRVGTVLALAALYNLCKSEQNADQLALFIELFPATPDAIAAQFTLYDLAFNSAKKHNSFAGYKEYVTAFPSSPHAKTVMDLAFASFCEEQRLLAKRLKAPSDRKAQVDQLKILSSKIKDEIKLRYDDDIEALTRMLFHQRVLDGIKEVCRDDSCWAKDGGPGLADAIADFSTLTQIIFDLDRKVAKRLAALEDVVREEGEATRRSLKDSQAAILESLKLHSQTVNMNLDKVFRKVNDLNSSFNSLLTRLADLSFYLRREGGTEVQDADEAFRNFRDSLGEYQGSSAEALDLGPGSFGFLSLPSVPVPNINPSVPLPKLPFGSSAPFPRYTTSTRIAENLTRFFHTSVRDGNRYVRRIANPFGRPGSVTVFDFTNTLRASLNFTTGSAQCELSLPFAKVEANDALKLLKGQAPSIQMPSLDFNEESFALAAAVFQLRSIIVDDYASTRSAVTNSTGGRAVFFSSRRFSRFFGPETAAKMIGKAIFTGDVEADIKAVKSHLFLELSDLVSWLTSLGIEPEECVICLRKIVSAIIQEEPNIAITIAQQQFQFRRHNVRYRFTLAPTGGSALPLNVIRHLAPDLPTQLQGSFDHLAFSVTCANAPTPFNASRLGDDLASRALGAKATSDPVMRALQLGSLPDPARKAIERLIGGGAPNISDFSDGYLSDSDFRDIVRTLKIMKEPSILEAKEKKVISLKGTFVEYRIKDILINATFGNHKSVNVAVLDFDLHTNRLEFRAELRNMHEWKVSDLRKQLVNLSGIAKEVVLALIGLP